MSSNHGDTFTSSNTMSNSGNIARQTVESEELFLTEDIVHAEIVKWLHSTLNLLNIMSQYRKQLTVEEQIMATNGADKVTEVTTDAMDDDGGTVLNPRVAVEDESTRRPLNNPEITNDSNPVQIQEMVEQVSDSEPVVPPRTSSSSSARPDTPVVNIVEPDRDDGADKMGAKLSEIPAVDVDSTEMVASRQSLNRGCWTCDVNEEPTNAPGVARVVVGNSTTEEMEVVMDSELPSATANQSKATVTQSTSSPESSAPPTIAPESVVPRAVSPEPTGTVDEAEEEATSPVAVAVAVAPVKADRKRKKNVAAISSSSSSTPFTAPAVTAAIQPVPAVGATSKRPRLVECSSADILTHKKSLAPACVGTYEQRLALDFLLSLYDGTRFPAVGEIVQTGTAAALMDLLTDESVKLGKASRKIAGLILSNIVLKGDNSARKTIVEQGILDALLVALNTCAVSDDLSERAGQALALLCNNKKCRQQMAECDLCATLLKMFNSGDSGDKTHIFIAHILSQLSSGNAQKGAAIPSAALLPAVDMLVRLMTTLWLETALHAATALANLLKDEEQEVILRVFECGVVKVAAAVLRNNSAAVLRGKVFDVLESLSAVDGHNEHIAELLLPEHNLLQLVLAQRMQSTNLNAVLSGVRFLCNLCATADTALLQRIVDSDVLFSLLAVQMTDSSDDVRELVLQTYQNFSLNATNEQIAHIATDGLVTLLGKVLIRDYSGSGSGSGSGKKQQSSETECIQLVVALETVQNLASKYTTDEQRDAVRALLRECDGLVAAVARLTEHADEEVAEAAQAVGIGK